MRPDSVMLAVLPPNSEFDVASISGWCDMQQVWHCSGCGRPFIASGSTAREVGFAHAQTVREDRWPATSQDFTEPKRWHWVGQNFLYCPACWHDEVDQCLLGNPGLNCYGSDDAVRWALTTFVIAFLVVLVAVTITLVQVLPR